MHADAGGVGHDTLSVPTNVTMMAKIRRVHLTLSMIVSLCALTARCAIGADRGPSRLPVVEPQQAGFEADTLSGIDAIVEQGIADGEMPGAVVLVARHGQVAWLKAYGLRCVEPEPVEMTTDTVFDLASITKPVATGTSIVQLVEAGQLDLDRAVAEYIPEFAANGKEHVTVAQLLTHQSGLIPDNSLKDYADGPSVAFERIHALPLEYETGTRFRYSDVNFLMLGELIERLSGQNVHEFSQQHTFGPLGMQETGYRPESELCSRAAPTEQRDGDWMQGEVHDPRAYALGCIAGHAGLFSTAEELAVYAQMLLGEGEYEGVRILKPETVELFCTPRDVPGDHRRTYGWDARSGYSSNRGNGLSDRAFGHGGFTGTVLWIDPELDLFYIFLSSRLHPDGKGTVNPLAGRIGTCVANAIRNTD
jgi:CubicO group peptidase (beta-lactamase class C family)